jgi:hypothetical protein
MSQAALPRAPVEAGNERRGVDHVGDAARAQRVQVPRRADGACRAARQQRSSRGPQCGASLLGRGLAQGRCARVSRSSGGLTQHAERAAAPCVRIIGRAVLCPAARPKQLEV